MSRSLPSLAQAARMASSSACAVGSRSSSVRLPARASTSPVGAYHHGADRHLAQMAGGLGFGQRQIHRPLAWARHICKLRFVMGGKLGGSGKQGQGGRARAAPATKPAETMRIAKAIAHAGLCSRATPSA